MKKTLAILLSCVVIVAALFAVTMLTSAATVATSVVVTPTVGSAVTLNSEKTEMAAGQGTLKFDPATGTLTCTDVTGIKTVKMADSDTGTLTVVLAGVNEFGGDGVENVLYSPKGSITVTTAESAGSLTLTGLKKVFWVDNGNITISGSAKVTATAKSSGSTKSDVCLGTNDGGNRTICFEENAEVVMTSTDQWALVPQGNTVDVIVTDNAKVSANGKRAAMRPNASVKFNLTIDSKNPVTLISNMGGTDSAALDFPLSMPTEITIGTGAKLDVKCTDKRAIRIQSTLVTVDVQGELIANGATDAIWIEGGKDSSVNFTVQGKVTATAGTGAALYLTGGAKKLTVTNDGKVDLKSNGYALQFGSNGTASVDLTVGNNAYLSAVSTGNVAVFSNNPTFHLKASENAVFFAKSTSSGSQAINFQANSSTSYNENNMTVNVTGDAVVSAMDNASTHPSVHSASSTVHNQYDSQFIQVNNNLAYIAGSTAELPVQKTTLTFPEVAGADKYEVYRNGTSEYSDSSKTATVDEVVDNHLAFARNEDGAILAVYKVVPYAFDGMNATLNEDISLTYYVKTNLAAPKVKFSFNGRESIVTGKEVGDVYEFRFNGIAPQEMGDTVTAELLDANGETLVTKNDYSVKKYLAKLKTEHAGNEKLVALVNDLLIYGGAAQTYKGYKTDALVSNGIAGSSFTDLEASASVAGVMNNQNGKVFTFDRATVFFDGKNKLAFQFTTAVEGVTFAINEGAKGEGYTLNGNTLLTDGINATEFGKTFTIVAYEGETVVAKVRYSVNSYVYAMQNKGGNIAALAKATYNYGAAAVAYAQ